MADTITIRVKGARDIFRGLDQFKPGKARSIARKAVGPASTPIVKAIKQHVGGLTHTDRAVVSFAKKSIGKRSQTYAGSGVVAAIAGPKTRQVFTTEGGQEETVTGWLHRHEYGDPTTPAQPGFRQIFSQLGSKVIADVFKRIRAGIEKEAKRT